MDRLFVQLGALTPLGGVALLAGWAMLWLAATKSS